MPSNQKQTKCWDELRSPRLVVLTVGLTCQSKDLASRTLEIIEAGSSEDVFPYLATHSVAVLLLGPRLIPTQALEILDHYAAEPSPRRPSIIVLCGGSDPELFQDLVDAGHIYYLAKGQLDAEQLYSLVVCGANRFLMQLTRTQVPWAANVDELLEICSRLPLQIDLASSGELLVESVRRLLVADRVCCLLYDADSETMTPANAGECEERLESAAAGLLAFVVRTGEGLRLGHVGMDPRYDRGIDNPHGAEDARFIAVPIVGSRNLPLAVIGATRKGSAVEFSEEDERLLELLCECAAPTFCQILLQNRLQSLLLRRAAGTDFRSAIFREEALEAHFRRSDQQGEVLKVLPHWLPRVYWIMVALVSLFLVSSVVGRVDKKATGPAVIRGSTGIDVRAPGSGRVRSIQVVPGNHVKAGDLLVLLDILPQPMPSTAFSGPVLAAVDGTVEELRVRVGQSIKPGDKLLSLDPEHSGFELVAFLPEIYVSKLRAGMSISVRMGGGASERESVPIESVGNEVLTPSDAVSYVGGDHSGRLRVSGRVVMVRASLPALLLNDAFRNSKNSGTVGEAEVTIGSEPFIVDLIPGLKKILGR